MDSIERRHSRRRTIEPAHLRPPAAYRHTRLDGRELRGSETRLSILLSVRLLADRGEFCAPVDVIAKHASCHPKTIYAHFGSVMALRMAALTEHIAAIDAHLQRLTPRQRVWAFLAAMARNRSVHVNPRTPRSPP